MESQPIPKTPHTAPTPELAPESTPKTNPETNPETNQPHKLDIAALDFSVVSQLYAKQVGSSQAQSQAIYPEIVTTTQTVQTTFRRDGGEYVETSRQASPGDAIITGPEGERYVLDAEQLATLYCPLLGADGQPVPGAFVPANIIKAIPNPTGGEIEITAPWGGRQYGEADCWLVESQITGERYIIEAAAFKTTYAPVTGQL